MNNFEYDMKEFKFMNLLSNLQHRNLRGRRSTELFLSKASSLYSCNIDGHMFRMKEADDHDRGTLFVLQQ